MAEQEHVRRTDPAPRPVDERERGRPEPGHPLLELQAQAGNAAVVGLVSLQRHRLDPEEEAGS